MEGKSLMRRLLDLISHGKIFSQVFATILRVAAVVNVVGGLVLWIIIWKGIFSLGFFGILGGLILQLFFVVAVYATTHILILRARDVANLPEADFTVIPIVALLMRLFGELYAAAAIIMSLGGGIFLWFGGNTLGALGAGGLNLFSLPFLGDLGLPGFVAGLVIMVGGVVWAFLVLTFFYFLSESTVVLVDIARHARALRQIAESSRPPAASN